MDDRKFVFPMPDGDTCTWIGQWLCWHRDQRFARDSLAEHTRGNHNATHLAAL
jgi:hypothetical protein